MRKDAMPQNETREIADSDLENVSGGILGTENLTSGAASALPGLPALPSASGSVAGGLNANVGPVSGNAGFSGGLTV
ncbi:type A2 lantipeptide [Streptomyces angustmyceticus]|uniref:type A2 lantipeptide n=1 Tax=Streptomyces angustmyceticus TaxID=285578 RepID=UPI00344BDF43